jgi:hypothetical protein
MGPEAKREEDMERFAEKAVAAGAIRPRVPIRPDIHSRFITVVARAEAKLETEQKAGERRHAAALAREKQARLSGRSPRVASRTLGEPS